MSEFDAKKEAGEPTEAPAPAPAASPAAAPADDAVEKLGEAASKISLEANGKGGESDAADAASKEGASLLGGLSSRQTQHLSAGIPFDDPSLAIPKDILDALILDLRFEKPSEIQAVTIPRIMTGKNVIAQAQTGSGKTVAFAIGMLAAVDPTQNTVQALCLAPTRELADQIVKFAIVPLSGRMQGIRYELLVPDDPSAGRTTRSGTCQAHIVVGTPGTIKSLISRKYLRNLNQTVKVFVCDEADTMVDQQALGQDTLTIKKVLSPTCQILFFSATYTPQVLEYARILVKKASVIKLKTNGSLVLDTIFQVRIDVQQRPEQQGVSKKFQVLKEIYGFFDIEQSIVFVTTQAEANAVAHMFHEEAFTVSFLHGGLRPTQRDTEMNKFRKGETKVLVTTNVLARGVDVPSVDVVVNYNLPTKIEVGNRADPLTYLHRMGRCGRFGRKGTAISLVDGPEDDQLLRSIEGYFNYDESKRMTEPWDANEIEKLGQLTTERSTIAAAPVELQTSIDVSEEIA